MAWPHGASNSGAIRTYLKFLTQIVNDSTKREQWVAIYSSETTRITIK